MFFLNAIVPENGKEKKRIFIHVRLVRSLNLVLWQLSHLHRGCTKVHSPYANSFFPLTFLCPITPLFTSIPYPPAA